MSDKTALGDRMKRYEAVTRLVLPRRTYTIIRVDGRAFHSVLRKAAKPFDGYVAHAMVNTAEDLCKDIQGARFAYTQSDEISILVTDFESTHTEAWFGGVLQKMVSISAAMATSSFGEYYNTSETALFDSRVFTIPDPSEVANYFLWRQRDAVKNSISMAAQANFPHKSLQNLNGDQLQEKLFQEKGINWSTDYPDWAKRGWLVKKETYEVYPRVIDTFDMPVPSAVRTQWVTDAAPRLDWQGWMDLIPQYS